MSAAVLNELIEERALVLPLRVEQYHAMIAKGILHEGAPYELLEGYVVRKNRSAVGKDPTSVCPEHAWVTGQLAALCRRLRRSGCRIQTQLPITLPPYNEPEPDGAIIVGSKDDYRDRHPAAKDVLCAIEVADASLRHDRIVKARIYARSGIARYVIINLLDRVIESYSEPNKRKGRYAQSALLRSGQKLILPAAGCRTLGVPARSLLP